MEKRVFKKTGEDISLLGFGCMRLPRLTGGKNDIDEVKAEAMLDYAYSRGVNYFDTAYSYHDGLSEAFAGRALAKYPRASFKLATKMPIWLLEKEADAERYFTEQLGRCGVDYFDFYLVHSLNGERIENMERLDLYGYLAREKKRGRIRSLGFSFHDDPRLLEGLAAKHSWDFAQIQLNYLDWEAMNAKLAYDTLTEHDIPVIVMEPVHGGTLANLPEAAEAILRDFGGASPASWAVRFAAGLPNVITVLSGMTTMEQVVDNINTMSDFKPLNLEERGVLERALVEYKKSGSVPCTGCRYCMECPAGVDIPSNFSLFNQFKFNNNKMYLEIAYQTLGKEKQARNCVECGQCLPFCPQFINIPEELRLVSAAVEEAEKE